MVAMTPAVLNPGAVLLEDGEDMADGMPMGGIVIVAVSAIAIVLLVIGTITPVQNPTDDVCTHQFSSFKDIFELN
ncbi:hypothetical protein FRB93_000810 [Tulasnella sp. JGI-2019a]|nr:hypothetical protein FRB93_000810 [Tulasnella sp. JGI-2019a]